MLLLPPRAEAHHPRDDLHERAEALQQRVRRSMRSLEFEMRTLSCPGQPGCLIQYVYTRQQRTWPRLEVYVQSSAQRNPSTMLCHAAAPAATQVHAALGLPTDHKVHWVDLHDAVTTALTHGKTVPAGAELLCSPAVRPWCTFLPWV